MTVRTSSASSAWDSTVKSTRSENRTVTSLRCSAAARSTSSARCGEQRPRGRCRRRRRRAGRAAPRARRWRRRSPPVASTTTEVNEPSGPRLVRGDRRLPYAARGRRGARAVSSPCPVAGWSAKRASASSAVARAADGASTPKLGPPAGAPGAASASDGVELARRCSASANASAHDGEDGELALVEAGVAGRGRLGAVRGPARRLARRLAPDGRRRRGGAWCCRPATARRRCGGRPGRRTVDSRTAWAPGSRAISRMPRVGSFHNATTRDGGEPAGPGALDHAERR